MENKQNNRDYFYPSFFGNNAFGLYLIGSLLVLIGGQLLGSIPFVAVVLSKDGGLEAMASGLDFDAMGISSAVGLALIVLAFLVSLLLLIWYVRKAHKKEFRYYIANDRTFDWKRLLLGFGIWFSLVTMLEAYNYRTDPESYEVIFNLQKFIPLAIVAFIFLPIQTSFEEFFFRGYLLQGWFITCVEWFNMKKYAKIGATVGTSVLFALMHSANPEIGQFGFWNMMSYYFVVGFALALVVILDNRIELALAFHAANNIFSATIVSYEGGVLMTDSILRTQITDVSNLALFSMVSSGIFIAIFYLIYNWDFKTLLYEEEIIKHA